MSNVAVSCGIDRSHTADVEICLFFRGFGLFMCGIGSDIALSARRF